MVSLPYSPDKYYLVGIDWIIHTLDCFSKKTTGCGNLSQVVLRLGAPLDENILKNKLSAFVNFFPCIQGRVVRDYNLAPYWKYPRKGEGVIDLRCMHCNDKEEVFLIFSEAVNESFRKRQEHIRFYYIATAQNAYFSLVFDHRLLDARGAEEFLFLFSKFFCGRSVIKETVLPAREAGLSRWKEKFLAGKRVNRLFIGLSRGASVRHIPVPDKVQGRPFLFRTLTFDKDKSQAIIDNAYNSAGYLMLAPYLLAISLLSVHECFKEYMQNGTDFVVPINTDIRSRGSGLNELFFNHLSFLFLRVNDGDIRPDKEFITRITRAMYDEISSGFTNDLEQASLLMRIVPLPVLHGIINSMMRNLAFSFAFSYVHKGYAESDFCGVPVEEIFHTPRVAVMPGIGVFFTQFAGNISVTLSFFKDMILNEDADRFMVQLEQRLLTQYK